jgi:hypothetical protein
VRSLALSFTLFTLVLLAPLESCTSRNPPNRLVVHYDAGSDADDGEAASPEPDASGDDASPYLGSPCVDDAQCDDGIACTYDSCDLSVGRCLNVPDDTQCSDGIYCDGQEKCVPRHGCEPGPVVTCSEASACEIARCVEATKSCAHSVRDLDGDGDPDAHCMGGHDCNDLDPQVSSLHPEVCKNGVDDNCNGIVDEMPCVVAQGQSCADAVALGGAGTYALSTAGANLNFATSCSVATRSAAENLVAAVTVPPGPNVDLQVWATTTSKVAVAVAIQGSCGQPSTELGCGSGAMATSVRARARNVAPGTYYIVVTTQSPSSVELEVDLLTASMPAANVDCATAIPIRPSTPVTVSVVDPPTDLPTACTPATGELTYSLTFATPQDVRVYASTVKGSGDVVVGLRDPACSSASDELTCRQGSTVPIFAQDLAPGTYVITVAATSPIDASLDVELSAPTMPAPDETCASPPPIGANAQVSFDLSQSEGVIHDGCLAGAPNAAFDLPLAAASDVLLIERLAYADKGAVSLDSPACDPAGVLACTSSTTPVRAGKRNVPPGDYRAVVADTLALHGTLDALVRPTVAPTILPPGGSTTCAGAVDASAGGFFTGDTSKSMTPYTSACDTPNAPPGGEAAQLLSLNLSQPQRVVLDMEGSAYTTILDVRQGPGCPGTAVPNACYVGFGAPKSFLDLELGTGQYFVIVSGFSGDKGAWDLDVRVLPP